MFRSSLSNNTNWDSFVMLIESKHAKQNIRSIDSTHAQYNFVNTKLHRNNSSHDQFRNLQWMYNSSIGYSSFGYLHRWTLNTGNFYWLIILPSWITPFNSLLVIANIMKVKLSNHYHCNLRNKNWGQVSLYIVQIWWHINNIADLGKFAAKLMPEKIGLQ